MAIITQEYLDNLQGIYKNILQAYVMFNPLKREDDGVAMQSIYSVLHDKHNLVEVRVACERLAEGGVFEIKNEIFVYPTKMGKELISAVTAGESPEDKVPLFTPPPISEAQNS